MRCAGLHAELFGRAARRVISVPEVKTSPATETAGDGARSGYRGHRMLEKLTARPMRCARNAGERLEDSEVRVHSQRRCGPVVHRGGGNHSTPPLARVLFFSVSSRINFRFVWVHRYTVCLRVFAPAQ
jgi:hypothetical protein